MKKVKTILASLMIILATAVLSACSCSGDNNSDIPQVPVTGIVLSSDYTNVEVEEDTKYLTIRCSRNDSFNITYTLSPSNTTRTQVDWEIEDQEILSSSHTTYSQSYTHTIVFKAKKVGYTDVIFRPANTDKFTKFTVIVGEAEAVRPSFVAPSGLDYNPATGKVTWNEVSQIKLHTGELTDVTTTNGNVSGLIGYIVSYTNITTGETYTTPDNQPISAREYVLDRGYTYQISVSAKGDGMTVKDSPACEPLKFHQLAQPTNVTNNNGKVTFESPEFSETNEVYYNESDRNKYVSISSVGKQTCQFKILEMMENLSAYNIYVVSYPKDFAISKVEGKSYTLDTATGIRYYPSIKSEQIEVQNLMLPTISITPKRGVVEVAGISFGEEASINNPYLSTILSWKVNNKVYDDKFGIKYAYKISKKTSGGEWTKVHPSEKEYAEGTSFDLSQLTASNEQYKLTVYTFGNSSNTIQSDTQELYFNLLNNMDKDETIITNDTLITSTANSNIYAVELFFINKDNADKSVYKFFDACRQNGGYDQKQLSINIANLKLTPGNYDIYGRFVGINEGTTNLCATSKVVKINNNDVIVASAVANNSINMSSAGILKFDKVSGIDDYVVSITQNQNNVNDSFARIITSDNSNTEVSGNKSVVSVNIYDIIKDHLLNDKDVTTENLESEFRDYTSNSTITINLISRGGQNVIDSATSDSIKFKRHNVVQLNTISLNQNELSFVSPNNSASYIIEINGKQFRTATYNQNSTVEVDLSEAVITNPANTSENNTTLLDYVSKTSSTSISIWAVGSRSQANNNIGYVDSYTTIKTIECTQTPTSLAIDKNGKLEWDLGSFQDEQSFELNFYTKQSGEWQNALETPVKIVASRETTVEEESSVVGKYSYNILQVIQEIGANKTIAVSVTHKMSDRFTNVESEKYYVVQLSEVAINKVDNGENPAISFAPLSSATNIKYLLKVTIGEDIRQLTIENVDDVSVVIKNLKDLNVENVGTYTITLSASKDTIDASETNPFVLNSSESSIEINVIDKQIIASANGKNISWNSLYPSATYKVMYKNTEMGDYAYIMNEGNQKVFTSEELTCDVWELFKAGTNSIVIIPSISYVDTGVVLVGETKVNEIEKLSKVSELKAKGGVLRYTLSQTFENNNYTVIVLVDGKQILEDEYSIDKENKKIEILSINYIGNHTYSLQISKENAISSDISSTYDAEKLASVNDLEKSGEWIQFTHIDGAYIYELTFQSDSESNTKRIKFDSENSKIYFENVTDEGAGDWSEVGSAIAKYENGKIYLKVNEDLLGIEMTDAGLYYYSIVAKTETEGKLNGNASGKLKLAKLSSSINVAVEKESFVLSGYTMGADPIEVPDSIEYTINYSKEVSQSYTKDSTWNITWQYDQNLFNANALVEYSLIFEKDGETAKSETISLQFNPQTNALKLITKNAEGQTVYEDQNYVNYESLTKKFTFDNTKLNEGGAVYGLLDGEPTSVRLEYIASKVAKTGSINFVTANVVEGSYEINLNELELIEEGMYSLNLVFKGNGNEVISSEEYKSENFAKLQTSTLGTQKGVLAWNEVTNASSYTIKISRENASGESVSEEGGESATQNNWLFIDYTFVVGENGLTMPNITEEALKSNNELFEGFEVGVLYNVQVMANGTNAFSSKWSDSFKLKKLQAPTNISISSTGNKIVSGETTIDIGEPMLTWSDPNNTSSRSNYIYKIGVDGEDQTINNTSSEHTSLTGQLINRNIKIGKYEVFMKVEGNTTSGSNKIGLLTSDYSIQNPELNYVTETETVKFENNTFTWNKVSGAHTYELTFYEGVFDSSSALATANKVFTTYTVNNFYNFTASEFVGTGYYTVFIKAYTDPKVAIVSTYVETTEGEEPTDIVYVNCYNVYKSPIISEIMVKDGLLAWMLDIGSVKELLAKHTSADDKLVTYFNVDDQEKLLEAVVTYIKNKIDNNAPWDEEVDKILASVYTFKANINGVETVLVPDVVDKVKITTTDGGERQYNTSIPTNEIEYLMFKYDMTTHPVDEDNATTTSQFVIQIAPKGNNANGDSSGLYSSVDGKYNQTLVAYKPKTPTSVTFETSEEENTIKKQIENGNLWWALVTDEDCEPSNFSYHKNYKITATKQDSLDNSIQKIINIDSTQVNDGETIKNDNIKDSNYYINLKTLFGSEHSLSTNSNYKLQISVVGTEDSSQLGESEKAYFNSNTFNYSDIMNILENNGTAVSGGVYSYEPCTNMSSATEVYVYGPFLDDSKNPIYAPDINDRSTWVWNVKVKDTQYAVDLTDETNPSNTYSKAVEEWKKIILPIWNEAKVGGWLNDLCTVYTFDDQGEDPENSSGRQKTLNLTGLLRKDDNKYGAGSYIIRKKEIGNGRGIIDTDFTDNLFESDNSVTSCEYENIATKLDIATKSITAGVVGLTTNNIWLEKGRFVWKKVERANAYKIKVEKVNNVNGEIAGEYNTIVRSTGTGVNEYFDMLEKEEFNTPATDNASYIYRIIITATNLVTDSEVISNDYFEGEDKVTDGYGRAPIPSNLSISETGEISWNTEGFSSAIDNYQVKINSNIASNTIADTKYDLSKVDFGTFGFGVRAMGYTNGDQSFINSCFTPEITITKLANPTIKVVDGQVTWGTETSEGFGTHPTKTEFRLNNGEKELLSETKGNYILHSEIESFDSDYVLENETYATGEYTFGIKYQGTYGEVTDNNRQFVIASGEQKLTATKLGSPILSSVDVMNGNIAENRIRWNSIENASGYRALIITQVNEGGNLVTKVFDIIETFNGTDYVAKITIKTNGEAKTNLDGESAKNYFEYNTALNYVDLRLSKVIKTLELNSNNGISLNVYVQAVGTLDSSTLGEEDKIYISGSFSDKKNVEIPAKPTNMEFDGNTGTLSWNVDDPSKGHNARINMSYTVTGISSDDLTSWLATADSYKVNGGTDQTNEASTIANSGRRSEIISRTITYTLNSSEGTYNLEVSDTIFLRATNNITPTSYQVTAVATNYNFSVRVMVGEGDYKGIYMSDKSDLSSSNGTNYNFQLFSYGDGSEELPYGITTESMFDNIRYYTSSHFVLENNISFEKNVKDGWVMIETFSGSIDGKGHKVEYISPKEITSMSGSSELYVYKAVIKENIGTIKNITLSVNSVLSGNLGSNATAYLSGFVITNNGKLENVHITTYSTNTTAKGGIALEVSGTTSNSRVAGLATFNNGTIQGCSVQTEEGIYGIDASTNKSTYVAGLVTFNNGDILTSFFSGKITGNFVAGITNENGGNIKDSYALGTATVTDIGVNDVKGKGVQFGGISGSVYGNSTIENCYSRLEIIVDIKTQNTATLTIGGIFATVGSKTGTTNNITIKNCYVVMSAINIGETGGVTITAYVVAPDVTSVTYVGNYYYVVNDHSSSDISKITISNSANVAEGFTGLDDLRNAMTSLKDSNNDSIYIDTITIDETDYTSKYPLLANNVEKIIENEE